MHVVVAPDGFGGVLTAREATEAIAAGWRHARPDDELTLRPLADGGEGLLDVVARPQDTWLDVEVAGPHGHPVTAQLLLRDDGTAVVESARACGLDLVPTSHRNPMPATTYGVGQLIAHARRAGASRVVVGLGGSATVDGGTGALNGLGFRLRVADGSGLKVGAADLHRVRRVEPRWVASFRGVAVKLLADVDVSLAEAARLFGPQKGASPEQVAQLDEALGIWADVAERDLTDGRRLRGEPGAGAAGGLGFGLAAGLSAPLVPGAAAVAELVGLTDALRRADVVVTGEGRLDRTSSRGKVVGHLLRRTSELGVPLYGVVGVAEPGAEMVAESGAEMVAEPGAEMVAEPGVETGLAGLEAASPGDRGPGDDPAGDVAAAAARVAAGLGAP